jgi:hypothetical protein
MIRPDRTRRIVFYLGDFPSFGQYVADQLHRIADVNTGRVPGLVRANAGADWRVPRGRMFVHLGYRRDAVHKMRGLSACAVDVVVGEIPRVSADLVDEVHAYARLVVHSATPEERQRERDIDAAMIETGEPYEIVVEAFEALDSCADEETEATP